LPEDGTAYHHRVRLLPRSVWLEREHAHHARLAPYIQPHLERRRLHHKHPVHDFLFTYYSYRPAQLMQWHPGFGVACEDGPGPVDADILARRLPVVRQLHTLLTATASRPPMLGCFGLHEWAMVYRQSPAEVRHAAWPLRHSPDRIAAIVDERGVRCSHFDAFRFFTGPARPLNVLQPSRESQHELEQGGCLHANMDLYKWACKLMPFTPSSLVLSCFELARDIRTLDMRASPYDLQPLGYSPVRIETPDGKAEYTAAQRGFADRARPLRRQLVDLCDDLLS